jgi:hypothetical protein
MREPPGKMLRLPAAMVKLNLEFSSIGLLTEKEYDSSGDKVFITFLIFIY